MKYLFYIAFFFVSILNAQNQDNDKVTYLDFNQKPTSKANAVYYEFETAYKKDIWKYQKFFIFSTTKAYLIEKYYYDKNKLKQGKYKRYFKTGTLSEEGIYIDNKKNGQWKYYASHLKKEDSVYSRELVKIITYRDNLKNGFFKEYDFDNILVNEGNYKNDKYFGECKWYHTNGQISSLEIYNEKGKLENIRQWDDDGNEKTKHFEKERDLEKIKKDLRYKISNELQSKINSNLYDKKGTIYVHFLLDKQGKIHVSILNSSQGVSSAYINEIKRVIDKMPNQKPIYHHNQLTEIRFGLKLVTRSKGYKTTKSSR